MIRTALTYGVLAVWAATTVTVIGLLMVNHSVAMPSPNDLTALRASVAARTGDGPAVVHFIHEKCSCTDSLLEHLFERRAHPRRHEVLIYVGSRTDRLEQATAAGYRAVSLTDAELLEDHGLVAAPVMVVLGPNASLQYAGGYFDTPAAVHSLDVELLATIDREGQAAGLPVFGCAVDPELRRQVDPLGLQDW